MIVKLIIVIVIIDSLKIIKLVILFSKLMIKRVIVILMWVIEKFLFFNFIIYRIKFN